MNLWSKKKIQNPETGNWSEVGKLKKAKKKKKPKKEMYGIYKYVFPRKKTVFEHWTISFTVHGSNFTHSMST